MQESFFRCVLKVFQNRFASLPILTSIGELQPRRDANGVFTPPYIRHGGPCWPAHAQHYKSGHPQAQPYLTKPSWASPGSLQPPIADPRCVVHRRSRAIPTLAVCTAFLEGWLRPLQETLVTASPSWKLAARSVPFSRLSYSSRPDSSRV